MAEKYAALGARLLRGDGADPEVFQVIPGVRTIPGPTSTFDTVDVSAHDSAGKFEEIRPTLRRTEEMAIEIVFDPADPEISGLKDDHDAQTQRNFQVEPVDAAGVALVTYDFAAYVIGYAPDAPYDGGLMLTATLKPTGAITATAPV